MPAGYVTNYGNAENDGLSWDTPLRSIQSAVDKGLSPIYIKGYFNEKISATVSSKIIVGVGNAIWDGTLLNAQNFDRKTLYTKNVTLQNFDRVFEGYYVGWATYDNVICRNIPIVKTTTYVGDNSSYWNNSLIINATSLFRPNKLMKNNTIFNSKVEFWDNGLDLSNQDCNTNLFSESSIEFNQYCRVIYSLFHNCTFKFSGGDQGNDETDFTAPVGANDTEKIDNLRQRMATVYGGIKSQYLQYCRYQTDGDLFIDKTKENFHLVQGCQASRMSFAGQFVGKYPEGSTTDMPGDFINPVNIDGDGNIIDPVLDASIETNIKSLPTLRHIDSLKALGERAIRNGSQINVEANLGPQINPGTDLVDGKTYIVRSEAISQTASGKTRDIGETFIAKTVDGLVFTNTVDGYVQEVFIDKTDVVVELKASKSDPFLTTAPWIKMKMDEEPMVNYDGAGEIQYGNGDADYDEGTAERLFIRYWKARITIKAKNLPG